MNFRTIIEISPAPFGINHTDRIQLFGSCFAEHIGELLDRNKFRVDLNPFGVLYNPSSIRHALELLMDNADSTCYEPYLYEREGRWVSLLHHSDFSAPSREELLTHVATQSSFSSDYLMKTDRLMITFGTAYVYHHRQLNHVVANCHKLPANEFHRYRLNIADIVTEWSRMLKRLFASNPSLRVVFTVSPIRHWKDGGHDNQLSKSVLLLAIDELCRQYPHCAYFPSYELMMDDLRDYRFYAEDMNHPSEVAVKYIWERIGECYFDKNTREIVEKWSRIEKALRHKPFSISTPNYRRFIEDTTEKLNRFASDYPFLDLDKETVYLSECLSKNV